MQDYFEIGKLIACYADESDLKSFYVGRVKALYTNWVLLDMISPEGKWNGEGLFLLSSILQVRTDTEYLKRLHSLLDKGDKMPLLPLKQSGKAIDDLFCFAKENKKAISIELYGSGFWDAMGFLEFWDSNMVSLRLIDENGVDDGNSRILLSAITRVFVGTTELHSIELLYQH